MIHKLIMCSALVISSIAQVPDVVNQTVVIGRTTSPFLSGAISSTGGMSTNILLAELRNAPSKTCTDIEIHASIQVSNDGINWTTPNAQISQQIFPVSGSTYVGGVEVRSTGQFPWTRANIFGWDTTNCIVDAFYYGTKAPISLSVNTNVQTFNLSSAGDNTLITNSGANIKGVVRITGLHVYNTTSTQTLIFKCGVTEMYRLTTLAAGAIVSIPLINPNNTTSYFNCPSSSGDWIVNLANASQVELTLLWFVN